MTNHRRQPGEGSLSQRHRDIDGCPPLVNGERPAHKCKGLWVGMVDLGIIDGKRSRQAVYGKTQAAAVRKLNEAKRNIALHGAQKARPMTVGQWLDHWLTDIAPGDTRESTISSSYRPKVARAKRTIGATRLDKIEPSDLRRLYRQMASECSWQGCGQTEADHDKPHLFTGRAQASIEQTHRILARAFTIAVRENKMLRNPAARERLEAPKRMGRPKEETEAMPVADLFALLDYIRGDRLESRWLFAISVGARQGEMLGLGWEDVDWERRVIRIRRSLTRRPQKGLWFVDPKSKKSDRVLPLAPGLLDSLARRYADWEREAALDGYDYAPALYGPLAPAALIWGQESGRPSDAKQDWAGWAAVLRGAGVPHCGTHAARHTVATLLSEAGAPAKVTQAILGHANVSLTLDVYTHAETESARPWLDKLDALFTNRPAIGA